VVRLVYSSTLKMEAIFSSETSLNFQRNIQRYIPEGSTLHNHRCENLRSYILCHFVTDSLYNISIPGKAHRQVLQHWALQRITILLASVSFDKDLSWRIYWFITEYFILHWLFYLTQWFTTASEALVSLSSLHGFLMF
jgi:hypothetical protein